MRALAIFLSICGAAGAAAADEGFRPATISEINRGLPGVAKLSLERGGFLYAPGSTTGYRVSKGEICVRYREVKTECVRVETDGNTLRMRDGIGNIDRL